MRGILAWCAFFAAGAALIGCTSATSDRAIPELEGVATFPGAADRMLPGARAIMTIEALLDGHEMYLSTRSAQLSAQVWEDAARDCFPNDPTWSLIGEEPAIPVADDPFWTATAAPTTAFRPLDDDWAREPGYGPTTDARLADDRLAFLDARVGSDPCVFDRMPFDGPNLSYLEEVTDPIGYLGLENGYELAASRELADLYIAFDEPLLDMLGTADARRAWETCMRNEGMPDEVVTGDFWEAVAMSADSEAIVVAESRCLRAELEAVDDELFAHAEAFVNENRDALENLPDITLEDIAVLSTQ